MLGFNINLIPRFTLWLGLFMVLILTAGTAFVMWLAELINPARYWPGHESVDLRERRRGSPLGGKAVYEEGGAAKFFIILLISLGLIVLFVFMDNGQRRIPVTFARRVVGRREMAGTQRNIPLKVNQSGVIPIIFASSVLYIPVLMSNIVPWASFQHFVTNSLTPTNFFYITSDFILILAFTFFYVYIAFEPHQQAEMLRQQGGFVPGIRPGMPTEKYFARMLSRLTVVGAVFLASVAVIPSILMALWSINRFPYYGTTLLIAVGVSLETMRQIDSQLMMRNYEGFLKR